MLLTCPACDRILSSRGSAAWDDSPDVICACGQVVPVPEAERPSMMRFVGRNLIYWLFGGFLGGFFGVALASAGHHPGDRVSGLAVAFVIGFIVGAIAGEKLLEFFIDSPIGRSR